MHVVSVILHLFNTLLVGLLALRVMENKQLATGRWFPFALSMLIYGLHPLLVETVVWISDQFDLVAMLFMLLGLVLNATIKRTIVRALCVTISFFLAAFAKESAAAFPLLLVIFDWFSLNETQGASKLDQFKLLLKRHWHVYVCVFAAGIIYIVLRRWAISGFIPLLGNNPLPASARLQEMAFLYVRYWRMLFWPTAGMAPAHPVPVGDFIRISTLSIFNDVLTIDLICGGVVLALRRHYVGGLILLITTALVPVPVLYLVGPILDEGIYNERYPTTALAVGCA